MQLFADISTVLFRDFIFKIADIMDGFYGLL